MSRREWLVALACVATFSCRGKPQGAASEPGATASATRSAPASTTAAASASAPARPTHASSEQPEGPPRFVAIGGGATPESTEVSIEQDIALARRTLPSPGVLLFAGGSDSLSVRELSADAPRDPLLSQLGELFQPRPGRRSRYRAPEFRAGRATLEEVDALLERALSAPGAPLLVYVAAHGDQGATARENSVALWGARPLTVAHLAELHDGAARPLRLVATSCFSGGFAELAFEAADERRGHSRKLRCGLFAGTWDRETSGCDPNPDRRAHESYGVHFLHALSRKAPDGRSLPLTELDFDGDGTVGLLDAHTRARISARSMDVPTTTSERWLRSVEKGSAPVDPSASPEDAAVVASLGAALGLRDEAAVEDRRASLEKRLDLLDRAMRGAEDELAEREAELRARLLERWPVLDDAFHPEFAPTLASARKDIEPLLTSSTWAKAREEALAHVDALDADLGAVELDEARVARLVLAYETLHKTAALRRRGGPAARHHAELVACERAAP